jgi:hypothetical protein
VNDQDNEYLPPEYAHDLAIEHARRLKATAAARGEQEPEIDIDALARRLRTGGDGA